MRGVSNTPRVSTETFLLMDRLYGTLDNKIDTWEQLDAMNKGCCGSRRKNDPPTQDLLKERLLVAYDLSSAFHHLHGVRLIYRDIKPENIGFDIRGDVKLFDFGLCKSLDPSVKHKKGYGFHLTAKTGSIPYMAPEVALGQPYDKEADVFSFSILLWEILSLDWAFNGYTAPEYFERVCKGNERLPIGKGGSWPVIMKTIVAEAWDKDPKKRPTMKRIGTLIRADLEDMTSDTSVLNRTEHMMNKSGRSNRILMDGSMLMDGSRSRRRSAMNEKRAERDEFVGGEELITPTQH
jgi:serine/threonine protein kinase